MKEETAQLGDNALHVSIGYGNNIEFPDRLGRGGNNVTRELEDGYLPIPHVRTSHEGLQWEETVFARLLDRRISEGLQPNESDVLGVFVNIQVKNASVEAKTGHLWLHFGDTSQIRYGYKAGQGLELGAAIEYTFAA